MDPSLKLEVLLKGIESVTALISAEGAARPRAQERWSRFEARLRELRWQVPLGMLAARYELSSFEIKCLLLALAATLSPADGDPDSQIMPTVGLAMDRFCADAETRAEALAAFGESSRLVRDQLVILGDGEATGHDAFLEQTIEIPPEWQSYLMGEHF